MSKFRSVLLMVSAVPLLIGCASQDVGSLEQGASLKVELLAGSISGPKAEVVQPKAPDRLLASLFKRNIVADIGLVDRRGTVTEWSSAEGATITLDAGVLIGTSGLSDDLYSADVEPLQVAMLQGGGSYARTFRYLDGERVIRRVDAACVLRQSSDGSEFTELCRETGGTFINRFKVEPETLRILASRQWIGREVGYLGLNPTEGP
jgi:hypothetical protein